jgi:hypothetical protein
MSGECPKCGAEGAHAFCVKPVPKRVAPSAETRDIEDSLLAHFGVLGSPEQRIYLRGMLEAYRSSLPPAATNCCAATEVEAARKPKRTLEERAQEAAEEIAGEISDLGPASCAMSEQEHSAWVKAIILSRIGGAD